MDASDAVLATSPLGHAKALKLLYIEGNLSDDAIKSIAANTALTELHIDTSTSLSDIAMRAIAEDRNLVTLSIHATKTNIDSGGLSYIASLPALKELSFSGFTIFSEPAEAGLINLAKNKSLQFLMLIKSLLAIKPPLH